MNTNDLNTALYEKMAAEQDKFRDWLKSQPPEEVLNHAYEYTIREDIVMAIEELELTDTQAQALLESSLPLADVYRYFEKLETGHMDVIRDSIENRADDVCRAIIPIRRVYFNDRHKEFRENIFERRVFYGNYKNHAASCWQGPHRKSGDQ